MTFEARVYIQGVAGYLPHTDREEILVLMPRQSRAYKAGIRNRRGKEFCDHKAFVQYLVEPGRMKDWKTKSIAGKWVGFKSDTEITPQLLQKKDRSIQGVPDLSEVLRLAGLTASDSIEIDPAVIADPANDRRLIAGAVLDSGILSPAASFEGRYELDRKRDRERDRRPTGDTWNKDLYSNTILIELGQISTFTLELTDFATRETEKLPLRPPDHHDEMQVWIRHFCDRSDPRIPNRDLDVDLDLEESDRDDEDFALNYALLKGLADLLQESRSQLPYPRLETSWQRGDPIGLRNRKCAPAKLQELSYDNPLS